MLDWLLDAESFTPRGCCGAWEPWLISLYRASNIGVSLAYFLLPVGLVILYWRSSRRKILPWPWMSLMFAGFILLCGMTHICDYLAFVWPAYRFFSLVYFLTAAVSLTTAALWPFYLHKLAAFRSPEEYESVIVELHRERGAKDALYKQLEDNNARLQKEAEQMRELIESLRFRQVTNDVYREMRDSLSRMRGS